MCALCSIFIGEAHWSEMSVSPPGRAARTRRHQRLHRVALANRILKHYGLKLSDWQGSAYLLSSHTGQSSIVSSIAAAWLAAEQMRKRKLDPLEERLIDALERD